MPDNLDELEELLMEDARTAYSEITIDYAMNPRNLGEMENADGFASLTGPCGDTIKIWLEIDNNKITAASFFTDGCGTSIASGGMVTEMAIGKSTTEALAISQQDVLNALGQLPDESKHCALLASNTLKAALNNYMDRQKNNL